jgi:hypothetical protein
MSAERTTNHDTTQHCDNCDHPVVAIVTSLGRGTEKVRAFCSEGCSKLNRISPSEATRVIRDHRNPEQAKLDRMARGAGLVLAGGLRATVPRAKVKEPTSDKNGSPTRGGLQGSAKNDEKWGDRSKGKRW